MDAKNINVLVGQNEISYSKINGSENHFMNNLYDHVLLMFDNYFFLIIYLNSF
jgi:hypothetical protein